jgi:putative addiction module killer protein
MYTIHQTAEFQEWLGNLADLKGRAKILVRIDRAILGNFGDTASVGEGVHEMRIDFGPGYRVYYAREGRVVYLLLRGGDKSTQQVDIRKAIQIWNAIRSSSHD